MKRTIEIETKTFVRFWLVLAGLVMAVLMLYQARVGLLVLGIALFMALALNEPVTFLAKRLPGKSRTLATALSYSAVVLFLGSVIFLVIPPIAQQTANFAQNIPAAADSFTSQWQGLSDFVERSGLQPQVDSALSSISDGASSWASDIGKGVMSGIGSIFSFFAALFLVVVLAFLMLIEGPSWLKHLWAFYADKEKMKMHRHLVTRMYRTVTGYVLGQLTVSAIGATVAGVAVFVLSFIFPNVPTNLAVPTMTLTFVLALIPMFGTTMAGILIMLLLALSDLPAAIAYIVFFVLYQQVENNLIQPKVQARRVELSPLIVLAAVTIGLYVFGIIGGVIAVPIAGSIRVLIEEYKIARDKREAAEKKKPTATLA